MAQLSYDMINRLKDRVNEELPRHAEELEPVTVGMIWEIIDGWVAEESVRHIENVENNQYCSICQLPYKKFEEDIGNNAQPINDGRCCDSCNDQTVLPARRNRMRREN